MLSSGALCECCNNMFITGSRGALLREKGFIIWLLPYIHYFQHFYIVRNC